MKKSLIIAFVFVGVLTSAFPFRTSCGQVVNVNDDWASYVTRSYLTTTLKGLNASICGVYPDSIVYY